MKRVEVVGQKQPQLAYLILRLLLERLDEYELLELPLALWHGQQPFSMIEHSI